MVAIDAGIGRERERKKRGERKRKREMAAGESDIYIENAPRDMLDKIDRESR